MLARRDNYIFIPGPTNGFALLYEIIVAYDLQDDALTQSWNDINIEFSEFLERRYPNSGQRMRRAFNIYMNTARHTLLTQGLEWIDRLLSPSQLREPQAQNNDNEVPTPNQAAAAVAFEEYDYPEFRTVSDHEWGELTLWTARVEAGDCFMNIASSSGA